MGKYIDRGNLGQHGMLSYLCILLYVHFYREVILLVKSLGLAQMSRKGLLVTLMNRKKGFDTSTSTGKSG